MLLNPTSLKSLNSIEKIQSRMMVAMFNSNPSTTIICYSPTSVSNETDLVTFDNELSSLVRSVSKLNVLIIGGDISAQIEKENKKFSLKNSSNRNEKHQIDFSLENRLTCFDTKFQKRYRKLWTYTYANNAKAQIDSILINKKWINSPLNCKAYSSSGVCFPITELSRQGYAWAYAGIRRKQLKPYVDWSLLNNKDISDKYPSKTNKTCKISKDKRINVILQWIPADGYARVSCPEKNLRLPITKLS